MDTLLKLENGKRVVVLDTIDYKGQKYLFLSDYDNYDISFAQLTGEDSLEFVYDEDLIFDLMEHVAKDIVKHPNYDKLRKEVMKK